MMKDGLVEEVDRLLKEGCKEDYLSMQGLGYKEIVPYIHGKCSLEEAADLLKKNTRHFAKRQITWFKREKDVCWINYEDFASEEAMLEYMINYLKEANIVSLS